ncbi:DUF3025 domain-containing protein [Noviherbaspirillum agri]
MDLRNHRGLPIQFVPQAHLPPGMAYEEFISTTGGVPTRENLHDFFNALMWLSFPKIKIQLNALQAAEIEKAAQRPKAGIRGSVRDAATIFDENAALLVVRDAKWIQTLRAHQWGEMFLTQRNDFEHDCEVWLFGHALMEKLVSPYKAITSHAWGIPGDNSFYEMTEDRKRNWLDEYLASRLGYDFATSNFSPLPVLGVPQWWSGQNDAFYADKSVFRPLRNQRK